MEAAMKRKKIGERSFWYFLFMLPNLLLYGIFGIFPLLWESSTVLQTGMGRKKLENGRLGKLYQNAA